MKSAAIVKRLAGLGGDKWSVHLSAKDMLHAGHDIILMTIGEPDVGTPADLLNVADSRMRAGRTGYSDGRGERGLCEALAECYTRSRARRFTPANILCFPGTQTALFTVFLGLLEPGDEVLVGDPMYATYEGVIRAPGAKLVPVPLRPEAAFRMQASDLAAQITSRSRMIFLNTPHNPTGAILTKDEIAEIGALAVKHDLWIVSDEVYEHLIFDEAEFVSPLAFPELANRVIGVSSISKSHAAPGFRSGWCVGPEAFCNALLPLSESMLFGNQPFIADMTEYAIRHGSSVAAGMCWRYQARSKRLAQRLEQETGLRVHQPQAGMFALIDVSVTGLDGNSYANDLLAKEGVAVMPGDAFGESTKNWVRVALTVNDQQFDLAIDRIITHAHSSIAAVS